MNIQTLDWFWSLQTKEYKERLKITNRQYKKASDKIISEIDRRIKKNE